MAAAKNPDDLDRRLCAIAFADVAGFSRLLAQHESATLREWKSIRSDILGPHVAQQKGRIAETAGDAVLVEFPSVVNAIRWAVDVQKALRDRNDPPQSGALRLRIGVNVEDIIDDEGVLQGDGVNIASRIHQAAKPGQIVVTSQVKDYVLNRLPVQFQDLGTPPLKNIDRRVHLFAVDWAAPSPPGGLRQPYLQWSTRPTVAVLPFRNIGGTEMDSYFGEGITEEIITRLSQSRVLYVIARTSTLHYRDRTKSIRQIADELDVRYVLDGSVRRWESQLRISAELTDVAANRPVWSERFDGMSDNLFEFQDQIASRIVGALEPRVQAAEVALIRERPTDSLDAYNCVLKAASQLYQFTDESYRVTDELLERALALIPITRGRMPMRPGD